MKRWSDAEVKRFKKVFPHHYNKDVATMFGRSEFSIIQKASVLGLKKSKRFDKMNRARISEVSTRTGYKKGREPENKGKPWRVWMSKKGAKAAKNTQFKKGNRPWTYNKQGTVTKRFDSATGRWYFFIKHGREMQPLHAVVYKQHYGRIPKGHIVVFKDGNTENVKPENLECISRAENMKRNSLYNYPPEIVEVIKLTAKLNKRIKQLDNGTG